MTAETITWKRVSDELPDADMTVLISAPRHDEPVWLGWYEDGCWFSVDAAEFSRGDVVAWAEMPTGSA